MVDTLEEEVLGGLNIGEEIILEPVDSNSALDGRIVEKMKAGDRVNSDLRYHRRNVPKSKSNYRRNDLPKTYLLADALLGEVNEYLSQRDESAIRYTPTSETLKAEIWDPYDDSEINGRVLSDRDVLVLGELSRNDFLPLKYAGNIYFVSERLLDSEEVSYDFIKTHGLDGVIKKLGNHLGLEILMLKEKLQDSKSEIIVVYGRQAEKQSVFPQEDTEHTSLLMENACESAGNGYGSRVPDELIKGGDEYLETLPGEILFVMHGKHKGIPGFHIDNPTSDKIIKSQKKKNP